jgi:hypothetical protein
MGLSVAFARMGVLAYKGMKYKVSAVPTIDRWCEPNPQQLAWNEMHSFHMLRSLAVI